MMGADLTKGVGGAPTSSPGGSAPAGVTPADPTTGGKRGDGDQLCEREPGATLPRRASRCRTQGRPRLYSGVGEAWSLADFSRQSKPSPSGEGRSIYSRAVLLSVTWFKERAPAPTRPSGAGERRARDLPALWRPAGTA